MKKLTLLLLLVCGQLVQAQTIIDGAITGDEKLKNAYIVLKTFSADFIPKNREPNDIYKSELDDQGRFRFEVKSEGNLSYIVMELLDVQDKRIRNDLEMKLFDNFYLIKDKDSVHMDITINKSSANRSGNVKFSGKGRNCVQVMYEISKTEISPGELLRQFSIGPVNRIQIQEQQYRHLVDTKLMILDSYKGAIDNELLLRLKKDMVARDKYNFIRTQFLNHYLSTGEQLIYRKNFIGPALFDTATILAKDDTLTESPWYTEFLFEWERQSYLMTYSTTNPSQFELIYNQIKNNYNGELRDRLLITCFLDMNKKYLSAQQSYFGEVVKLMAGKRYREMMRDFVRKNQQGKMSLEFAFMDEKGNIQQLSDYRDKIIVMDFWFNGCHGCLQIPPVLAKVMENFQSRTDVVFMSVNVDRSKQVWERGLASGKYTIPGQVHVYTNGNGWDDPFLRYYNFNTFPQLFVIGKGGKILSTNPKDPRNDQGEGMIELIRSGL